MKDIFWLVKNILRVTFKSKKGILLYICTPLIGIFISFLSYGGSGGTILQVGIVDHDHQAVTTDTIKFIKGLENVKVKNIKESDVSDQITEGKLDCVITLDKGFAKSVLAGNPNHISISSIKGATVTSYIKSYLYNYIDNISAISKASNGDQNKFDKMYADYHQPQVKMSASVLKDTSKYKDMTNQTIGYLLMIMLISASTLAEIILKEKGNRTYYRLLSTPINAKKYISANIIVNLFVMVIQIIITLLCLKWIFHININMPVWQLGLILLIFGLVAIGFAQITVAFTNSTGASGAMQNLFIVPTCLLSGCFFPAEIMPKALQKISDFLPQHWVLETITKLQQGAHLGHVTLNFMILLAFAVAFFLIAIYKISRNNNVRNFV
ncbi:ABC transporter permease [Heyndrickxia shackletonii]|uniref:ABC transporter permease n=1 Tax=Heyndrickxia shackletonii TaxID=157838 RepID=A0A0Q3WUN6_9BACI|nr:ABC transporter permease [Heyndrickxia shackletonii]KQL52285.1 ABC transporter permease [Heyndrickxia shackletonii]NEZ00306.1 ABC transporter permease [Heyndrickxia shackletonii]